LEESSLYTSAARLNAESVTVGILPSMKLYINQPSPNSFVAGAFGSTDMTSPRLCTVQSGVEDRSTPQGLFGFNLLKFNSYRINVPLNA
jgi:hypothetical protein